MGPGPGVEFDNVLLGDIERTLTDARRVGLEVHPPLAPVQHVRHDDHEAPTGQFVGDASAAVVCSLELVQFGVLRIDLDELLLAPEIEPPMVVESDDGRRALSRPLGTST